MDTIEFLNKREMLTVNGGDAYSVGKTVGKFCADLVDWFEGFSDGFKAGFDN